MPNKTVAIIGLGAMGSRMAKNFLSAGYPVVVYNRSVGRVEELERLGARRAMSPKEAALSADVLISIVTNDEASEAVWLSDDTGAIHGLSKEKVAITSSTLTPEWVDQLAAKMEEHQFPFLEAPVVGTRPQAEQGELVYLVGGEERTLEQVSEVLDVLGGKVVHLGATGTAMKMKLVINAMLGIQAAMLGEMVTVIRRHMEAPEKIIGFLKALPVMSPLMSRLMGKMEPGNYSPNFPIELVEKDLSYFVESLAGAQKGRSFVEATRKIYAEAKWEGYGEDDITGIIQLFES